MAEVIAMIAELYDKVQRLLKWFPITTGSLASSVYATTSEIADVADTESAGSSATVARGDHVHARGSVPAVWVYNNANISCGDNAQTTLTFNSEFFDNNAIHDTSSNPSRLTCKTAGLYTISGHVMIDSSGTAGIRELEIVANLSGVGSILLARQTAPAFNVGGTSGRLSIVAAAIPMAVNDYVELVVSLNSAGAACNALAASSTNRDRCSFGMVRVGPS